MPTRRPITFWAVIGSSSWQVDQESKEINLLLLFFFLCPSFGFFRPKLGRSHFAICSQKVGSQMERKSLWNLTFVTRTRNRQWKKEMPSKSQNFIQPIRISKFQTIKWLFLWTLRIIDQKNFFYCSPKKSFFSLSPFFFFYTEKNTFKNCCLKSHFLFLNKELAAFSHSFWSYFGFGILT